MHARRGCKGAHPLSSCYPLQGSSGETVLQLQVSKSSFSADASCPCSTTLMFCQAHGQAKPAQKLFTGATLFQAPKSLWPSFSQPYWAHFSVLLPPELNAVVSGDLGQIYSLCKWFQWCPPWTTLSLSTAITTVNQHPERFPQLHFTLLVDDPRAQGLDSKAKA